MKITVSHVSLVKAIRERRDELVAERTEIETKALKESAAYRTAVLGKLEKLAAKVKTAPTGDDVEKLIHGARYNWPDAPESDNKVKRQIEETDEILKRLSLSNEPEHVLDEKSNYFEFV